MHFPYIISQFPYGFIKREGTICESLLIEPYGNCEIIYGKCIGLYLGSIWALYGNCENIGSSNARGASGPRGSQQKDPSAHLPADFATAVASGRPAGSAHASASSPPRGPGTDRLRKSMDPTSGAQGAVLHNPAKRATGTIEPNRTKREKAVSAPSHASAGRRLPTVDRLVGGAPRAPATRRDPRRARDSPAAARPCPAAARRPRGPRAARGARGATAAPERNLRADLAFALLLFACRVVAP